MLSFFFIEKVVFMFYFQASGFMNYVYLQK